MDTLQAIMLLRPNTHWNMRGDVIEQVEGENKVSIPSQDEIQAVLDSQNYVGLRQKAYPPLADLADALVHQANGDSSHLDQYIATCNAVKAKYPKPE